MRHGATVRRQSPPVQPGTTTSTYSPAGGAGATIGGLGRVDVSLDATGGDIGVVMGGGVEVGVGGFGTADGGGAGAEVVERGDGSRLAGTGCSLGACSRAGWSGRPEQLIVREPFGPSTIMSISCRLVSWLL